MSHRDGRSPLAGTAPLYIGPLTTLWAEAFPRRPFRVEAFELVEPTGLVLLERFTIADHEHVRGAPVPLLSPAVWVLPREHWYVSRPSEPPRICLANPSEGALHVRFVLWGTWEPCVPCSFCGQLEPHTPECPISYLRRA